MSEPVLMGIIGFVFLAILIFIIYKTFFGGDDDMERQVELQRLHVERDLKIALRQAKKNQKETFRKTNLSHISEESSQWQYSHVDGQSQAGNSSTKKTEKRISPRFSA